MLEYFPNVQCLIFYRSKIKIVIRAIISNQVTSQTGTSLQATV